MKGAYEYLIAIIVILGLLLFMGKRTLNDKVNILSRINKTFPNTQVAVRSSSYLEDSFTKSLRL